MIKEAIKYVVGLGKESQEIITKDIKGETYVKGDAERILPDYARREDANTLKAIVDYTKDCLQNGEIKTPYIINTSHDSVVLKSGLDKYKNRETLMKVEPLLPRIRLNDYLSMEEFIIQLNTCFVESENVKQLTSIVSTVTDEAKVVIQDDGVGMSITQTTGTGIVANKEFTVNPICRLAPYSTFGEVEQVERKFLLRIKDGGRMALFEADGGVWKLSAQDRVTAYLEASLQEEIEQGKVKIIG